MPHWSIRVSALLALAAAAAPALAAQSRDAGRDLGRLTLEELMKVEITTASRLPDSAAEAPARVEVVTADQIRRRGYRSLLDVLKDLPDVKVDLRGNWDYPTEMTVQGVRGIGRLIVLLDGVRVSGPTNEPLPIVANYPVHTARQIEIVYGPSSALYGADAFSAVVNIITQVPSTRGASMGTSVGQFGLYDQTASFGTPIGDAGSLLVAAQYQYDGQPDLSRYYPQAFGDMSAQRTGVFPTLFGVMTPDRPISPTYHIPMWSRSLQASYRQGGFRALVFESRSHLPTTAGVYTPDNVVYDTTAFNENGLFVASGSYLHTFGRATSTTALTYSRQVLDPRSGYMDLYSNMDRSYKYAYGSMTKVEQQVSWKPMPRLTMTAGGTLEHFFAIPQTADLNAPVRSQDAPGTILGTDIVDPFVKLHYNNIGAFGEGRYTVRPSLIVTASARADHNTRFGTTFNPRVGLVAHVDSDTTVKVLFGTAFLAPSPYQEYQHYGSFLTNDGGQTYTSSYWHLPNPDLRPQHKRAVEVNLARALGADMSVSTSAFYSRFTDLIQPTDPDQAHAGTYHGWPVDYIDFPVNEGRETVYGGNVTWKLLKPLGGRRRLGAHVGLSYADGRIWPQAETEAGLPIGGMAPLSARAGLDIDWDDWTLAPRVTGFGRQRFLATQTAASGAMDRRTLAGYWTADLTVRRAHVLKHVDAFATAKNLFDARYRTLNDRAYINAEEFLGIPQNPRRLTVGFDLHFE